MGLLIALFIILAMLFVLMAGGVLIFRTACGLAGVAKPSFPKAAAIAGITFLVLTFVEGGLAALVRMAYQRFQLPVWEAGLVAFFAGLPVDLLVASGIHAGLLGIRFGKSIEVWFVHRLILLSLAMLLAGIVAVALLAANR